MIPLYRTLEQMLLRRSEQVLCDRCGLLYAKSEASCPHCDSLSDVALRRLLNERRRFHLSLGKGMLYGASALFALLLLLLAL
ncbi:MAG: hypothetical protein P8103_13510 [Candidatus Thiodiazotropha sp.]|jgi:hypothetical protein